MKKFYFMILVLMISFTGIHAQSGKWMQQADLPQSIKQTVSFVINGKGYVVTGGITAFGDVSNQVWEYDPSTDTWTQKNDFSGPEREDAFGFSVNGKGYIGGGWKGTATAHDFWEYDPGTDTWTQKSTFTGIARTEAVGFSIGSKGYVTTGDWTNFTDDLWEYDPSTDTWTQKADFPGSPRDQAVGVVINGKAYVGFGISGIVNNDWYEYDPATDTWSQKTDYPLAKASSAVGASLGNRGFVGVGSQGGGYFNDEWYEYDAANDKWIQKTLYPEEMYDGFGFGIGNMVYVGGGEVSSSSNSATFYAFDPSGVSGMEEPSESEGFSIYPVPANDRLHIDIDNDLKYEHLQITIMDQTGKIVYETVHNNGSALVIPLPDLKSGIYMLSLKNKKAYVGSRKFVIIK